MGNGISKDMGEIGETSREVVVTTDISNDINSDDDMSENLTSILYNGYIDKQWTCYLFKDIDRYR